MGTAKVALTLYNGQLAQVQTGSGDFISIASGGTGGNTIVSAQAALNVTPGTYTQTYSSVLTALAGLASTGLVVQTGASTFADVSIAVASTARLTVTNGSGVAGNPTLDLATVTNSGSGTFQKLTTDSYGRVTGTTSVLAADVTGLISSTYIPIAGGGTLTSGTITLYADPVNPLDAATKQYVDARAAGLDPKATVIAVANTTITLSGTQTIDGVAVTSGQRVLVNAQAGAGVASAANGIYICNSGAWTLAPDWSSSTVAVPGSFTFCEAGTNYSSSGWVVQQTGTITPGTTPVLFVQFSGAGEIIASYPLTKSGNTLSLGLSSRLVTTANVLDLPTGVNTSGAGTYTSLTVDTYGRVTSGGTATPATIGAAPASTTLVNLAALAGTGILVQTGGSAGSATFAERTITSSGSTVTITNGSGVAGNINVDLVSGVNTSGPGTYTSVTVDTFGRVTAGSSTGGGGSSFSTALLTNSSGSTITKFMAVTVTSSGNIGFANASSSSTINVLGLIPGSVANGSTTTVVSAGELTTGSTADWDAVTGQTGGLTSGAVYYLSNTTNGKITTTAPTSGFICPIGYAESSTNMQIRIGNTVQL